MPVTVSPSTPWKLPGAGLPNSENSGGKKSANAPGGAILEIPTLIKIIKVLYTTQAISTGGREGKSATADGALAVTLTTPKELGGDGKRGTNPEQLFACGYSACFLGALKFVAGKTNIHMPAEA